MEYPVQFLYRTGETDFIPVSGGTFEVTAEQTPVADSAEKLTVTWKNAGDRELTYQLEIRVKTGFRFTHYVIPAVLYNGNGWGKGREPKGTDLDGEPWIFDHRRTSIPACTVSENKDRFFAMFASNEDEYSLNASCSMIPCEDGSMIHRILYPCIEKPKTYRNRDSYCEAHEDFITLKPGESVKTTVFLVSGVPEKEYCAAAQAEDLALDLLASPFEPKYTPDELQYLCCEFAKQLLTDVKGHKLICTGRYFKDGAYVPRVDFEFGWCGQNGLYGRLFIESGYETDAPDLSETGIKLLDFWADRTGKTGLVYTNYNSALEPSPIADTCNLGYVISEFTKAYLYLKNRGTAKKNWIAAAINTAHFLISRYSEEYGFGKSWNVETGECTDPGGTIGAYIVPALCTLYTATGREECLIYAKKACRLYCERDLSKFMCTAGALDTCCIDKETSAPLLSGCLALYELEKADDWLELAKMAGWYFCSWMFHHDTLSVPGSDFETYGYRTLGGTSVSAQHHHLDPWGAFVVPEMLKLRRYTGDDHWKQRADLMLANAIQNIAPREGMIFHGHERFPGAQNEAYFHCSWGGGHAPGEINEWLVSWPQAFIWNTVRTVVSDQ